VDVTVEVGEFTTTIPDPNEGRDWKESLDDMPSSMTVRGGAMGICRLISSKDMDATGITSGVFNLSFCDSPLDRFEVRLPKLSSLSINLCLGNGGGGEDKTTVASRECCRTWVRWVMVTSVDWTLVR